MALAGSVVVVVEVRRARVVYDWDGSVGDVLGLELSICGSRSTCRFEDVSDFEWDRARWIPWGEL